MSPALMGRPFSVEHIVLAYGAEDPRFEPGRCQRRSSLGRYKVAPNDRGLKFQHSCCQTSAWGNPLAGSPSVSQLS